MNEIHKKCSIGRLWFPVCTKWSEKKLSQDKTIVFQVKIQNANQLFTGMHEKIPFLENVTRKICQIAQKETDWQILGNTGPCSEIKLKSLTVKAELAWSASLTSTKLRKGS